MSLNTFLFPFGSEIPNLGCHSSGVMAFLKIGTLYVIGNDNGEYSYP